jgi:hypothetical protein
MSQWNDRLNSHEIHNKLNELDGLLNQAENKQDIGADSLQGISRLRSGQKYISAILGSVDPNLVPVQPLNQIGSQLTNINTEITAFNTNGNIEHINNANSNQDTLLIHATQIPRIDNMNLFSGAKDALSIFNESAGRFLKNIENNSNALDESVSELSQKIEQLTAEITTQKSRLDTAISQYQQQFSESESSRVKQFSDSENLRTKEAAEAVSRREEKFQEMLKGHELKFSEELEELHIQVEAEKEKLKTGTTKFISEIESLKKRAEDLVYVIANTGMVGGYQKIANSENTASVIWKLITIISMAGLIGFAIVAANSTFEATFDIAKFSARAFVSSTFGILAAYSARQASKHDEVSHQNRKMELEIASIDPFIVGLPEETKYKIKERLANRMFAQRNEKSLEKSDEITGTSLDTIKMMIEALHELIVKPK